MSEPAMIIIYYLIFRSAISQGKLSFVTRQKLLAFKKLVNDNWELAQSDINKADFDLTEFERLSHQRTNEACSIKERLRILEHYLKIETSY